MIIQERPATTVQKTVRKRTIPSTTAKTNRGSNPILIKGVETLPSSSQNSKGHQTYSCTGPKAKTDIDWDPD